MDGYTGIKFTDVKIKIHSLECGGKDLTRSSSVHVFLVINGYDIKSTTCKGLPNLYSSLSLPTLSQYSNA